MKFIINIDKNNLKRSQIITSMDIDRNIKKHAKEKGMKYNEFITIYDNNEDLIELPCAPLKIKTRAGRKNKHLYLTTHELAYELGIGVSTVVRYIDMGIVKCCRLPTGKRRIPIEEVEKIKEEIYKICD